MPAPEKSTFATTLDSRVIAANGLLTRCENSRTLMKTAQSDAMTLRCDESSSATVRPITVISQSYASLIAEAKRRVQKTTPTLSNEQWEAWLAFVAAHDGQIVLQLDGARAEYSAP
jgi:hypothetical protein